MSVSLKGLNASSIKVIQTIIPPPPFITIISPSQVETRYDLSVVDVISLSEVGEYSILVEGHANYAFKAWGAAGGYTGGTGGYSYGEYKNRGSNEFKLWVGGGGITNQNNVVGALGGFGGGGHCGRTNSTSTNCGSGGGLTGLFKNAVLQENSIIIAGGGGGGYYDGGVGGGTIGTTGASNGASTGGQPGTQTSGGLVGVSAANRDAGGQSGGALFGGNGSTALATLYSGGGGGGGYFGGGAGGGNNTTGASGGGGSGYISPSLSNAVTTSSTHGSLLPPNNTDQDFISGTGVPSRAAISNYVSGNGLFIIRKI